MIELFRNPVTVIFGLLAAFFVAMSFGRHVVRKRNRLGDAAQGKPYNVSDPYAEPEVATAEELPAGQVPASRPAKRYFNEFGASDSAASSAGRDANASGYVWE
jgi:hypothetical protein